MHPVVPLLVDLDEPDILGGLPAHAGPGDDRRGLAQLGRPLDSRVLHRLARRNHGELREAVHEIRAPVFEVGLVAVLLDLRAVLKTQSGDVGGFDLADAAAAFAQRFGELAAYCGPAR